MSDLTPIQTSLKGARSDVKNAQRAAAIAGGAKAAAQRELEAAKRRGDKSAIQTAASKLAQAEDTRKTADQNLAAASGKVSGLLKEINSFDPAALISQLLADFPVALLPVRLETRFFNIDEPNPELRLRIYPDDVHVDSHEPELTVDEEKWGRAFWEGIWRAGSDTTRARNVWSILLNQAGPNRAAWVAKAMTPTNAAQKPVNPIAENAPLAVAPAFPAVDLKGDTWTRPAMARVLPDRWVAIGYRGGAKVGQWWGSPIPDALAVSLDPNAAQPPAGDIPVDDGIRWMVDFNTAEQVGMGIRIGLPQGGPLHFDQLLVLGVKASADQMQGADLLAGLLDAHHYGRGLEVLRQGTPTNNSSEKDSPYNAYTADPAQTFANEFGDPLFTAGNRSDGSRLTSFLGIGRDSNNEVFGHIHNAGMEEYVEAGHMNAALWPATWGYFLDVMMEGAIDSAAIERTRRHFVDWVRGRGPLPALRIGRQPYGVVPAVSLTQLQPVTFTREEFDFEGPLLDLLRKLRAMWRSALPNVPRIGRTGDIDQDLTQVLGMDPEPLDYAVRDVTGPNFAIAIYEYLNVDVPASWWNTLTDTSLQATKQLGINALTPLSRAVFDSKHTSLNRALVSTTLSEKAPLSEQYFELLLNSTVPQIRDEDFAKGRPNTSLLYVLLRHAILMAYASAATKIAKEKQLIPPQTPKEPELINMDPNKPTMTVWDQMKLQVQVGQQVATIGDILQNGAISAQFDTPELKELLAAFEYLKGRPSAAIERCMTETLDLSTCRLDPWITSLAAARLVNQRLSQPTGVFVGGYGYVEGLKPDTPPTAVIPPPGEANPVFLSDAPAGYVHAPSMAHAAAAAVLRSGHLSHSGASGNLLAVDLSSSRVRVAQWIIEGVRQGQPLGALLGYRFERGLHDKGLDVYIAPFRVLAPLVANKLEQSAEAVEAIAARNVVDGLRLQRMWKEAGLPWGQKDLPLQGTPEQSKLENELKALDATVDSVSDAVVAESVYQAVQGNLLRSGASLDAVAAGDVPPPELEVTRTPRTGVGLTHRVAVLCAPQPNADPAWPLNAMHLRRG